MIRHMVEQGSQQWHELRLGMITSTRLKKLMGSTNLDLMDELIAEQELGYSDEDDFISDDMQRGIDLEPLAIEAYEFAKSVKTEMVGMLQSDEIPLLSVSPDRLVGDNGAVEVKCPRTKTHIKAIRQGGVPNEYKYQVLMYFLVHEKLEWLDFVSYDPRLIRKPLYIYRVERQDIAHDLEQARQACIKFIAKMEKYREEVFF